MLLYTKDALCVTKETPQPDPRTNLSEFVEAG